MFNYYFRMIQIAKTKIYFKKQKETERKNSKQNKRGNKLENYQLPFSIIFYYFQRFFPQ